MVGKFIWPNWVIITLLYLQMGSTHDVSRRQLKEALTQCKDALLFQSRLDTPDRWPVALCEHQKITHINGRLLDQAVVLFNCVPFRNGNFY